MVILSSEEIMVIPIDNDHLLNRWDDYVQSWCDKFDTDHYISVKSDGAKDANDVNFKLGEIDDDSNYNGEHTRIFKLGFYYGEDEDYYIELSFRFDSVDQKVVLMADIADHWSEDAGHSFVVSYSPKYGREIQLLSSISTMDIRFVELLFSGVLEAMGFVPNPSLDFDSVCAYAKKQVEFEKRCEKIWVELADCRNKVSEVWDDFITQYGR